MLACQFETSEDAPIRRTEKKTPYKVEGDFGSLERNPVSPRGLMVLFVYF